MRVIREDPDPNKRFLAYRKLAEPYSYTSEEQKAYAATLLVDRLNSGDEPVATRAVICRTLGEIRRPEARDVLVSLLEDPEPIIRAEAARSLGKVGRPDDALLLTRLMTTDSHADCQLAAIEGLGEMRSPDPRVYLVLAEGMENQDPAVRLAALRALRSSTGEDLGVDANAWSEFARTRVASVLATADATPR